MKNYGLQKIISQVRRDEKNKSSRTRYDFELSSNKICVTGDKGQILKIINYQFPLVHDFKGKGGRNNQDDFYDKEENGGCEVNEEIRKKTVRKIKKMVHDLAEDNFTRKDRFVTLVPAEQILDLKESNRRFELFIKKLQYNENKGKTFKYIAGIHFEQKNRTCIHYHVLWDLHFISQKRLLQHWGKGKGSVYINRINKVKSLGDYLVPYISESAGDDRFAGNKAYLCSKGLKRRKWTYASNEEVEAVLKEKGVQNENKTYEEKYETELYGWRTETEYNLERSKS